MKIAQVVCTFPPYRGGIGNVVFQNARYLSKWGHEVTVFVPKYNAADEQTEFKRFKVVRLFSLFKYGNAAIVPQLLWRLRKFDIVHLHYPAFGMAEFVWLLKKIQGKKMKLIISYHMDVVSSGLKGTIFKYHSRWVRPNIFKAADKVLVASFDYMKNSGAKYDFHRYKHKFVKIPFGADDMYYPKIKDPELLKNYKLTADNKVILFVGGLDKAHYFKGLTYLIEAFIQLNNPDIKLMIVGSGDMKDDYYNKVKSLGLSHRVIFTGFLKEEELADHYNLADVFVLPSIDKSEAFGIVLVEAGACAKPVIASNLPGVRSVVKNGLTGFLTEPRNVDDLKNKIEAVLYNPEFAFKMGQEGHKRVEKKYRWDISCQQVEQTYNSLFY